MSSLTNTSWKLQSSTASPTAHALPFPGASEASVMRQRAMAFRDTMIVIAIQMVFRATLAMRRWNY